MILVDKGTNLSPQYGVGLGDDMVHGESEVLQKIFDRS
jgi:hypothetical protein